MTNRAVPDKISLVFCDVDGTLVTDDKRLTPASTDAVRQLRAAGTLFAIGSSRPPRGLRPLAEVLDLDTPIAAFNGGSMEWRNGVALVRHCIPSDVAEAAIGIFGEAGANVWLFTADQWLVTDADLRLFAREQRAVGFEPMRVRDFSAYLDQAGKIVAVSDNEDVLARCESEARRRFGERASIAKSQAYYVDVTDRRANKAQALALLGEHYNIEAGEIVAIGDGLNDVGMLREAGFAVAMGNAPDVVRRAADHITATNEEDGFALAIAYLLSRG